MTRPKDIGTAAETAVVRYLRANGFPHAERRALAGQYDLGDVTGIPGVVIEVKGGQAAKNASDGLVTAWLAETEQERLNANADVGMLVMARSGMGPANVGRWWAVLNLGDIADLARPTSDHSVGDDRAPVRIHLAAAALLLRDAGYGVEPEHEQGDVPDDGTNDDPWTDADGIEHDDSCRHGGLIVPADPPQPVSLPCPGEPDCVISSTGHIHFEHP